MPNPFHIPGAPTELMSIINAHRERFAGLTMSANPPEQDSANGEQQPPANPPANDGDNPPLNEGGMKALKAERDARKALEDQVKALEPIKAQMDALAAALGKPAGESGPDLAAQVAEMREQLDKMNAEKAREALVDEVARAHPKLTAADVTFMRVNLTTREAMTDYAKRVGAASDSMRRTPDRGAGRGGSSEQSGSVSSGRDLFNDRHAKNNS